MSVLLLAATLPLTALAAASAQEVPGESNLGFLLAGTALAWAGFFAYAFYIGRKDLELRRDIEELRQVLADRDSKQTSVPLDETGTGGGGSAHPHGAKVRP